MISRKTLINLLSAQGYNVQCIAYSYVLIQNPQTHAVALIPYRYFYSWLALRGHFWVEQRVFKLHWKITLRMLQLMHESNKQSKKQHNEQVKKNQHRNPSLTF